jgi:hypothetical protein
VYTEPIGRQSGRSASHSCDRCTHVSVDTHDQAWASHMCRCVLVPIGPREGIERVSVCRETMFKREGLSWGHGQRCVHVILCVSICVNCWGLCEEILECFCVCVCGGGESRHLHVHVRFGGPLSAGTAYGKLFGGVRWLRSFGPQAPRGGRGQQSQARLCLRRCAPESCAFV